jgi:hypothetical protein
MRSYYLFALIITLSIAGTHWYKTSAFECPAPLAYRIGEIDESFALSNTEALAYVFAAESLWESEVNRELFVYDESADFTINFVFDERQETSNSEIELRETLDEQKSQNEKVLKTVESLQIEHKNLSIAYKTRVNEYENRLAEHNTKVNQYNDRGGAPADVFEELEKEQISLSQEVEFLSKTTNELNDLAAEINRLGDRGNDLVSEYNHDVGKYNTHFGFAREFTQGDYQGNNINIYKFSSDNELVMVLAHEFGHALGIEHVEGTSSLMYYLLQDAHIQPEFSNEDLVAYQAVCGVTETTEQKVRRIIREFLAKIK